jgi:hypothetical protein
LVARVADSRLPARMISTRQVLPRFRTVAMPLPWRNAGVMRCGIMR